MVYKKKAKKHDRQALAKASNEEGQYKLYTGLGSPSKAEAKARKKNATGYREFGDGNS